MDEFDPALPELNQLIEQRLVVLRTLAESLESSRLALMQNDAQAIARGAAHQAELCRQWSSLEDQLRRNTLDPEGFRRGVGGGKRGRGCFPTPALSASLQAEWEGLSIRIRYLARVHVSLLRHMQRSLAVMNRVLEGCAQTYTLDPGLAKAELRPCPRAGG
jgi:hypothetical protein